MRSLMILGMISEHQALEQPEIGIKFELPEQERIDAVAGGRRLE